MKLKKPKNPNYCATVAKITNIIPLDNCDNVVAGIVLGSQVIVGKDAQIDEVGIFLPTECRLSKEFLSNNNLYRHSDLNENIHKKGYIEDNGRLKTMKFRGHKSEGLFIGLESLVFASDDKHLPMLGDEFDELNDIKICEKYIVVKSNQNSQGSRNDKTHFKNISRMVDGQFHFHPDTKHLKRNLHLLQPESIISISKKLHGTSAVFSNILVQRKLNFVEKTLQKFGVKIQDKEYDVICSSRKVIKNKFFPKKESFYSENIWEMWKDKIKNSIPKGFSIYAEIVGYLSTGKYIQKGYHYGQDVGTSELYIYKITFTNEDGKVYSLDRNSIDDFCYRYGFKSTPLYYYGIAKELYPEIDVNDENWTTKFTNNLDHNITFNMGDSMCSMNNFKVPAEGVVVRIEELFDPKPLKLKNYKFLEFEGKQLDTGEVDIEEEN